MKKILSIMVVATIVGYSGATELKKGQICESTETIETVEVVESDAKWESIFDGKTFNGWRGCNKTFVPAQWAIEDGAIKFKGKGDGGVKDKYKDRGDIIFDKKFDNFELELEWKASKGANSGIFYLAQEIKGHPMSLTCPEYQILDNANHNDAKAGKDGNRMSASLYDMIPAKPQNQKPYGEWNKTKIVVYKGKVVHYQNDVPVLEYHLWTPQWKELLDNSKFSKMKKWPLTYDLMLNCGGDNREGYIGLQDHGNVVWFRNIKVRDLN